MSGFKNEQQPQVVGSSVRIDEITQKDGCISLTVHGMEGIQSYIRLYVPHSVSSAVLDDGNAKISLAYDEKSSTVLLSFASVYGERHIILK